MPRNLPTLAVLALLTGLSLAPAAGAATPRPLVYVVVVDGLDTDRVTPALTPTLAGLRDGRGGRATWYEESRSVMIAETNPNHTAMLTGAYGGSSGVPGNAFALYAPLRDGDACATTGPVDRTRLPTPTSGESAGCLLAPTLFEAVERQGDPDGLVTAAVLGKPKLGRLYAGRRPDGRPWADHLWAPCTSGADDDAYCADVATNPVTGYALDDRVVMDEVVRTIREGAGPGRRRPDFTFVNLPLVDSAGHLTGTGPVYDAAIRAADDQLARLVGVLRERGEWERTVLLVVSDHAMDTTLAKRTLTAAFAGAGLGGEALVVQNGSAALVYLRDRTAPGRFALLRRLREAALRTDGVAAAWYREPNPEDQGTAHVLPAEFGLAGGERVGDLVVQAEPGVAFSDPEPFSNPLVGNHGGTQTRDNAFLVAGGGAFVRQARRAGDAARDAVDAARNPGQAENVDVAPTVAGLLGLAAPAQSQGRFLGEAFDLDALPGAGRPPAPAVRVRVVRRTARARVVVLTSTAAQTGPLDVERRTGPRWVRAVRNAGGPGVRLVVPRRGEARLRVRQSSAAGRHGAWRVVRVR